MGELSAPVTLAEQIYALSKVIHIRKYANTTALSDGLEGRQKHLRLLDDIALLLVTQGESDVAAVTFTRTKDEVRFYYAKNRPMTAKEVEYLDDVLILLQSSGDVQVDKDNGPGTGDPRVESLLAKVVDACRKKVRSRIRKLKRDLPADCSVILRDDLDGEMHEYFVEKFDSWYGKYNKAHDFLMEYFNLLENLNVPQSSPHQLCDLIRVGYRVSAYKQNMTVLIPDHLARRLRLVGDYFGAVKRIVKSMDSLRMASKHGGQLPRILFEEIRSLAPPKLSLVTDYQQILNQYAAERNLPQIEGSSLAKAYPTSAPRFSRADGLLQSVAQSVHAECKLAVHMIGLKKHWKYVEIGVSKSSCWLCEIFLTNPHLPMVFHLRNVHGKLQAGWTLPPLSDKRSKAYMTSLLHNQLEEVLLKSHDTTHIASSVRSGSDSDEHVETAGPLDPAPFWVML